MNNHTPTVEETAQAVTAAKASPIFAAAYDAVFEHMRTTNRTEALKAAKSSYDAARRACDMRHYADLTLAADLYSDERNRIDKEYPQ
jgi:hypothetical protein